MNAVDSEGQLLEQDWWSNPSPYDASVSPSLLKQVQVSSSTQFPGNFFRFAKWCPDGSCILAQGEDRSFTRYDLPAGSDWQNLTDQNLDLSLVASFPQPDSVYDFVWYPSATPSNPSTFCFIASVRAQPIKLLDAQDGRLRASYKIIDHRERFIAPNSMAFNCTSDRLYCGFEDAIEVFDVSRPGEGVRLSTSPTKKSKAGQKGIISALSFCPDYSGLYGAGSFSGSFALYSEQTGSDPVHVVKGLPSGITQLKFHPRNHMIYTAFRKNGEILCWDVRNLSGELARFKRKASSNQRLAFDIEPWGRWLAAGGEDGSISIFDVSDSHPEAAVQVFQGHRDAVGSIAFHPFAPLLLSVSGARHFEPNPEPPSVAASETADSDSDSGSNSNSEGDSDSGSESVPGSASSLNTMAKDNVKSGLRDLLRRSRPMPVDASLSIWRFANTASDGAHMAALTDMGIMTR